MSTREPRICQRAGQIAQDRRLEENRPVEAPHIATVSAGSVTLEELHGTLVTLGRWP